MKRVYIIKLLLSCFAVTIFFIGAASCKSNGTQISDDSLKDGSANDIIIPISDENSIKHEHKDIN